MSESSSGKGFLEQHGPAFLGQYVVLRILPALVAVVVYLVDPDRAPERARLIAVVYGAVQILHYGYVKTASPDSPAARYAIVGVLFDAGLLVLLMLLFKR